MNSLKWITILIVVHRIILQFNYYVTLSVATFNTLWHMPQMVACPCSWDPDFRTNNPTAYKRRTNQKKKKEKRKKPARQRGIWPEEQRQRYLLRHSKERERVCVREQESSRAWQPPKSRTTDAITNTYAKTTSWGEGLRSCASFSSFLTFCGELSKATGYVAVCVPHIHTELTIVYVSVHAPMSVCVREEKRKQKWWTAGSLLICCNRIRRQAALKKGVFRLAARLSCSVLSRPSLVVLAHLPPTVGLRSQGMKCNIL